MTVRAVLALVLLAAPAAAQPAPAQPAGDAMAAFERELDTLFVSGGLTSEQAAVRAVKISPTVRAKAANIDIAVAQATTAELTRVPRIGGSATYSRLSPLDPVVFQPGAPPFEFPTNSYALQGQVQLPLSDYLVRFPKLIDAARAGTEAARLGKRASEVDAGFEAKLAYYEWVRARLQLLVSERQLAQIRTTLAQFRALAEAQRVSRADLMRVESQEAQMEQLSEQLQKLASLREEQLRILIGETDGAPLTIGEDIRTEIVAPALGPLDASVDTATKQRFDIQAYDVGIRAKVKERESEAAARYPRLSAFATVDYARPNQRAFLDLNDFVLTWQVGAQLTWTLNDTLISNAQTQRIGAEIRELRANRENIVRGTRIAVLSAQQSVTLAERAMATSRKGLAAAEESYRVRQALLAADRATAVEIVDAEADLTRARILALDARVDLRIAMVQLAHALGNDNL